MDDAIAGKHTTCVELLRSSGAPLGAGGASSEASISQEHRQAALQAKLADDSAAAVSTAAAIVSNEVVVSADAPRMLFAAADNDVDELIKLADAGEDLLMGDYDRRTACHLAASNGHLAALKYIVIQVGSSVILAQDRWGNNALDDAKRNGHTACLEFLASKMQ